MSLLPFAPCLHYECNNRNNAGYCKSTACINPKYSYIGTAQYGQGVQKRIITNADRIRAMSDEELAEWLIKIKAIRNPEVQHKILGWLKQEAKT